MVAFNQKYVVAMGRTHECAQWASHHLHQSLPHTPRWVGHVELSSSTPAESTEATHKVRSLPTRVQQNHAEHGRPAKGTHNGLEARRGARRD